MPEDTELPPLDAPIDEWDEKWTEKTTITVDRWLKAQLDHDREGQPWNEYFEGFLRLKNDPLTFSEVEHIADHLRDELETDGVVSALETIEQRTGRIERQLEEMQR